MPRLRFVEDREETPETRAMIESAQRTGAPDPRVVRIMEIIELGLFCGETVAAGRFVRSLDIVSWAEACALNPLLARTSRAPTAA